LLLEYSAFIEEVIAMQSYNTEVLVRSINFSDPSSDLYYGSLVYNGGPRENSEPLFFAPCFDRNAPLGMEGIQFISRVYYQDRFDIHDANGAQLALSHATEIIKSKTQQLAKRKTTAETINYLNTLHAKWSRGIRRMPAIWPKDHNIVRVLFLGEPMRLPTPLTKHGGMIGPGFGMMLETLLSTRERFFNC
jgi:hypothetical protein